MSPAPGWYFGGKNPDEQFGGFNLGGVQSSPPVQSTVATPNPASAGVAGQPSTPSPTGGMTALSPPFGQPDPTSSPTAPTADPSNANVTGFSAPLAAAGLQAATFGLPGMNFGLGTIGNMIGNMAAKEAGREGLGTIPSNMTRSDTGEPVTFTPPDSSIGRTLLSFLGVPGMNVLGGKLTTSPTELIPRRSVASPIRSTCRM